MAKNTTHLGLYEKESTDGTDTFNITTMLNDNWDKIDTDSKAKDDAINEIKQGTGVTAGTYKSVTVDTKGRVTAGSNPTTRDGYGLSDVYTKDETSNKFAPSGYGLGGNGKRLNSVDLNTVTSNGWYDANSVTNGVPDIGTGYHKLLVICSGDANYVTQIAFSMTNCTLGTAWIRELRINTWSSWRKFTNKDELDTHIADTTKHIPYLGTTTNSGNVYTISAPGEKMSDGDAFRVKFNSASTGPIYLKINSTGGAVPVYDFYGNAVTNVKQYTIVTLLVEIHNGVWSFMLDGKGGDGTATASDILEGKTATTKNGLVTGSMKDQGLSVIAASYRIANSQDLTKDTGLIVRFPEGYYHKQVPDGVDPSVQIAEPNLISSNIKAGKSIFGVTGKSSVVDTADATAVASQIRSGKTAYINGNKVTGTLPVQATGAQTITPGTSDIVKKAGIYDGDITVKGIQPSDIGGRKYASGSGVFDSSATKIIVTGLNFIPTMVYIETPTAYYSKKWFYKGSGVGTHEIGGIEHNTAGNIIITSGGFETSNYYEADIGDEYSWVAIE